MIYFDEFVFPEILNGEDQSSILGNCIKKNYRHLRKWAKRTQTNCFRIYDRDIKQYPFSIDFYAKKLCVHHYLSKKDGDETDRDVMEEINQILFSIFGIEPQEIYWRNRIKRKKIEQYEKKSASKSFFTVFEYGVKFLVNLEDYLDTGLFLDHRETRQLVSHLSAHKKLLNLFSYTCAFSVHAANAKASFTKSVDLSNTYTQWGIENFNLNHISLKNHEVIRADCLKFLFEEAATLNRYDLIVIDPPTVSRSKKMEEMFDIQKDYLTLLQAALKLLNEKGVIIFSTNFRQFAFDYSSLPLCKITEITHKTIPHDFHNKKIHRCWTIEKV